MVPTSSDGVIGSLRIRNAKRTALAGTKLINRLALVGPRALMPS